MRRKRYRDLNIFGSFNRRICNAKKLPRNVLRERRKREKLSFSIDFIHTFFRRINIGFELEGFSSVKNGTKFYFYSFTWMVGWLVAFLGVVGRLLRDFLHYCVVVGDVIRCPHSSWMGISLSFSVCVSIRLFCFPFIFRLLFSCIIKKFPEYEKRKQCQFQLSIKTQGCHFGLSFCIRCYCHV